jgi:hypothetical protein
MHCQGRKSLPDSEDVMSLIAETYHNEKMIEQYRNEEKCAVCGHERYVHKSGTHQCPADDPYKPIAQKTWLSSTFRMGE